MSTITVTIDIEDLEALAGQLLEDAHRALRRARRAGADYVSPSRGVYRLRLADVIRADGRWTAPSAEAEEAAADVERLLGWHRRAVRGWSRRLDHPARVGSY